MVVEEVAFANFPWVEEAMEVEACRPSYAAVEEVEEAWYWLQRKFVEKKCA